MGMIKRLISLLVLLVVVLLLWGFIGGTIQEGIANVGNVIKDALNFN